MTAADYRDPDDRQEADAGAARDASVPAGHPGPVDDVQAQRAAEGLHAPDEVAASYQDMLERAAEQRGEGRLP